MHDQCTIYSFFEQERMCDSCPYEIWHFQKVILYQECRVGNLTFKVLIILLRVILLNIYFDFKKKRV